MKRGTAPLLLLLLSQSFESSAAFNASFHAVPLVDLAGSFDSTASTVRAALSAYGFFYITNHGVPQELIDRQFEQARLLFEQPAAVKAAMPFNGTLDIGYLGSGGQALDAEGRARDTKEGFMLTNNGVFDPSFVLSADDPLAGATLHWPPEDALPKYEGVLRAYTAALSRLNRRLNQFLFAAVGLGEAERLELARQPFHVTKQLRYVPAEGFVDVDAGSLGAGAHADWGSLTILATDGQPGLEVEHSEAGWLPVPPRDGCLIVNAGDQVKHWTNGELKSANHRVVVKSARPRFSTAFFAYFDLWARLEALPQFVSSARPPMRPPETTLELFHFKLGESVGNARERGGALKEET